MPETDLLSLGRRCLLVSTPDVLGLVDGLVDAPDLGVSRVVALRTFLGVVFAPVLAGCCGEGSPVALSALQVRWARLQDNGNCDLLSVVGLGTHGMVCMGEVIQVCKESLMWKTVVTELSEEKDESSDDEALRSVVCCIRSRPVTVSVM